jgi:hypothetical protein
LAPKVAINTLFMGLEWHAEKAKGVVLVEPLPGFEARLGRGQYQNLQFHSTRIRVVSFTELMQI